MTFELTTEDYYELLAMHRTFLEAKFNNAPNDYDVAKSPIVNKMYSQVLDTLIQAETEKNGEAGKKRWLDWLNLDKSRREWEIIVRTIRREKQWSQWDLEKQQNFIKEVSFPFTIDSNLLAELMSEISS